MGRQVDSKRERAGNSWERGSVVASLQMHSCAHMFMSFFMRANGWAGEHGKWVGGGTVKGQVCVRLELVTHVQESILFHAGKWMGGGTGKGQARMQFLWVGQGFGVNTRLQEHVSNFRWPWNNGGKSKHISFTLTYGNNGGGSSSGSAIFSKNCLKYALLVTLCTWRRF